MEVWMTVGPRLVPSEPDGLAQRTEQAQRRAVELQRRAADILGSSGSAWARVAVIIPRKMALDMLAWAEADDDVALRFVLTKPVVRGERRIDVSVSQKYWKGCK